MLSWLYGKITDFRNALYEKNLKKSFSLGAKTVSIGNITVGGTGKTPLVAFVAEILAENGEKVCVLTRGYGRKNPKSRVLVSDGEQVLTDAANAGDEPFELAQKLFGKAVIVADADRVSAAEWAREKFGVTAFVLDDAFQHRRARRDLDIVCIDATAPFGNFQTLPSGILRESIKNLKRADLFVITRANLSETTEDLRKKIREFNSASPIFSAENRSARLTELQKFSRLDAASAANILTVKNQAALAFCALGNPKSFFAQLRGENYNLAAIETFPDHHFYTKADIAKIQNSATKAQAEILLTTAKDAVKLKNFKFSLPCFVVEIEMRFDDEKSFREIVQNI